MLKQNPLIVVEVLLGITITVCIWFIATHDRTEFATEPAPVIVSKEHPKPQPIAPTQSPSASASVNPKDIERATVPLRIDFARRFDTALLDQQLNPNAVSAVGPNRTTLNIDGICSRQFLYDLNNSDVADQARAVGFKRITCQWESVVGSIDLRGNQ